MKTFKPYYFNGQVVRGYAVFTLFNQVKAKDIYLRVKGFEVAGRYNKQALSNFKKTLLSTSSKNFKPISMQAMNSSGMNASNSASASRMSRGNTDLQNIYKKSDTASFRAS